MEGCMFMITSTRTFSLPASFALKVNIAYVHINVGRIWLWFDWKQREKPCTCSRLLRSTYVSYKESKTASVSKFTILSFSLLPKFQNGASDFTTASPPPSRFQSHPGMAAHIAAMETRVMAGSLAPSTAADILLDEFMLSTRTETTCMQQS